jgi:uncharacterized membrane protein YdfJ with MMPL/SSD domain
MLRKITDMSIRRPRLIALAGVIAFVVMGAVGSSAPKVLTARVSDFQDPGSASTRGRDLIAREAGAEASPGVLVYVNAPPLSAEVAAVTRKLAADPDVAYYVTYAETRNRNLVSRDGQSTVIPVGLHTETNSTTIVERLKRVFASDHRVMLGGSDVALVQVDEQSSEDLRFAEMLVFPLLALLAFAIFRGVAVFLPLVVGGLTFVTASAVVVGINSITPLSVFVLNMVMGLGVGLGVDYSLFLVSRFREEIGRGADTTTAVRTTMVTAGRTVAFSAFVIAAAGASLIVFPMRFLWSVGLGGVLVALIAGAISLTVLPAAFMLFGQRIGRHIPGPERKGRWYRLARTVTRRPGITAAATAAALLLVASPSLRVRWTGIDASILPTSKSARLVSDHMNAEFPRLDAGPMVSAIWAPANAGHQVEAYAHTVERVPGIRGIPWISYASNGVWWLYANTTGPQIDPPAQRTLEQVRHLASPFRVVIGGEAAEFHDQQTSLAATLPLALAILVATTLLTLWVMTGSVVLPIKALVMNALTVGVATGVLVLLFQDGRLTGLLAYRSQGGIQAGDFLVLVALTFALSTDYGVFLLARIKEARDAGLENREAVAIGLQRTGYIVTAAALLLATAIGAFAISHLIFLKEVGIGAIVGLLVDAFLVRALLVPSLMALLGRLNWWQPALLRRLHTKVTLRGAPLPTLQQPEGVSARSQGLPSAFEHIS